MLLRQRRHRGPRSACAPLREGPPLPAPGAPLPPPRAKHTAASALPSKVPDPCNPKVTLDEKSSESTAMGDAAPFGVPMVEELLSTSFLKPLLGEAS